MMGMEAVAILGVTRIQTRAGHRTLWAMQRNGRVGWAVSVDEVVDP
jgi:hypothetical protein